MTNLSKELKRFLSKKFDINSLEIISKSKSSDGTNKYLFRLHQGNEIEGVLIPSSNRVTACVSSQAGCSLDCSFCATGKLDLKKNLDFYEIYEQIFVLNKESHKIYNKKLVYYKILNPDTQKYLYLDTTTNKVIWSDLYDDTGKNINYKI